MARADYNNHNNSSGNSSTKHIKSKQNLCMYRFCISHACADLLNTSKWHNIKCIRKSESKRIYWIHFHCLGWLEIECWTKESMKEKNRKKTNSSSSSSSSHNIKINVLRMLICVVFPLNSLTSADEHECCNSAKSFWSGQETREKSEIGLNRDLMSSSSSPSFVVIINNFCDLHHLYRLIVLNTSFSLCSSLLSNRIESVRFWFNQWKYNPESFPHHFTHNLTHIVIIITIIEHRKKCIM